MSFKNEQSYVTRFVELSLSANQSVASTTAIALVLASDFGGSDITVSLRAISTSGNAIYPAQLTGSTNGRVVTGALKILQN